MTRELSHLPQRHVAKIPIAIQNPHPQWTDALSKLRERLGRGMICALLGDRGTGKTQMAVCLCWYTSRTGETYHYMTAYEMFTFVKSTYADKADMTEEKALRRLTYPGLLVIDELNEANKTTWEGHVLAYIIDKRYAAMKDTLLISNYDIDQFESAVVKHHVEDAGVRGAYPVQVELVSEGGWDMKMKAWLRRVFVCGLLGLHDWTCAAIEGIAPTKDQLDTGAKGFLDYAKMYCRRCGVVYKSGEKT